jgi:hypothetical protein
LAVRLIVMSEVPNPNDALSVSLLRSGDVKKTVVYYRCRKHLLRNA